MSVNEPNLVLVALPGGKREACRNCPLGGVSWPRCPSEETLFSAGTIFWEIGTVPQSVLLVKEGMVGLSMLDYAGAEVGCSVRGPRSLLGLESLVSEISSYRVWALTEVKVCQAPRDRLAQWTGSLETPMGALVRLGVEEANRRASERLDVGGAAVARIARLLLRRCVETARTRLELSQRLLARVLSMTPETVSRAVAKLHAAGAVTSTRPIVIGDVDALRRFTRE